MSWALLTTLFAILGTGLAVLSVLCLVLWRQVHALTRLDRPAQGWHLPADSRIPLSLGERAGVRVFVRPGRSLDPIPDPGGEATDPHPGPLPEGEGGGKRQTPETSVRPKGLEGPLPKVRYEVARRLDELTGRHRALEARLARIEASATEAAIAIASGSGQRVDRGSPATSGGPTLIAVPNLAAPPTPALEAAAELDRRFGDVWAMADAGMPAESIARETGQPIGQVELILGLRRQIPAAEAGPDV